MAVTVTIDMTGKLAAASVRPKMAYSPVVLQVKTHQDDVELLLDDEQLAEIEYAIQRHRAVTRAHESPDQQMILNHEYEEDANETHRAS